jgi:hypothetical protein
MNMAVNGSGMTPQHAAMAANPQPVKVVVQAREGTIEGLGYTYKARIVTINPQTDLPEIVAEVDMYVNDKKNLKGVVRALARQIAEKESGTTQIVS